MSSIDELGELTIYAGRTLRGLPSTLRHASEVFRQLALLVRGSTFLIFAMCAFIGVSGTNYGYFFLKSAGAADYVGLVPGLVISRLAGFTGRRQVSIVSWRARATVSFPAGTECVTVEPAPMVAPAPTTMGATSTLLEPVCTSSPIVVRFLRAPS